MTESITPIPDEAKSDFTIEINEVTKTETARIIFEQCIAISMSTAKEKDGKGRSLEHATVMGVSFNENTSISPEALKYPIAGKYDSTGLGMVNMNEVDEALEQTNIIPLAIAHTHPYEHAVNPASSKPDIQVFRRQEPVHRIVKDRYEDDETEIVEITSYRNNNKGELVAVRPL